MKKLLFLMGLAIVGTSTFAQNTNKGTWLLEVGTNAILGDLVKKGASTGLALYSSDGETYWSLGSEAGYLYQIIQPSSLA